MYPPSKYEEPRDIDNDMSMELDKRKSDSGSQ